MKIKYDAEGDILYFLLKAEIIQNAIKVFFLKETAVLSIN